MATDKPAYPPYFDNNDPTDGKGFESAVAYAIAQKLGFPKSGVTWVTVPFNASFAPGPKKFDFDVNEISITKARQKAVDFSAPYFTAPQAVVALSKSPAAKATTLSELGKTKLGVQIGTTSLDAVQQVIKPSAQPQVFDNSNDVITALKTGRVDAVVVELPAAFYVTAAQVKGSKIVGQFKAPGGDRGGGRSWPRARSSRPASRRRSPRCGPTGRWPSSKPGTWAARPARPYCAEHHRSGPAGGPNGRPPESRSPRRPHLNGFDRGGDRGSRRPHPHELGVARRPRVVLLVVGLPGVVPGHPRRLLARRELFCVVEVVEVVEVVVLVLGLAVALCRVSRAPALFPLRLMAVVYTDVLRGVPTILLIFLIGFGVPALRLSHVPSDPLVLGGFALALSYGAYVAEVYRAGIESVHPSQRAAGLALGLTGRQTLRYVVVPQAVRRVAAPLLNDFVSLQKDVALVSILGPLEAFRAAQIYAESNYTSLLAAACLYLIVTIPLARLVDRFQRGRQARVYSAPR